MQVHTKKHPTDDMITLRLKVHRHNAPLVKRYAETIESEEKRTYTVAEVFPEYIGKESQVALRAYRTREDLTQKQLSELTGIPATPHKRDGKRQTQHRQGAGQETG